MPTSLGSLEFTLEDWTQEYSNQDNWKLFLSYCEETFCIPRDEFVTKEAFITYYEYFHHLFNLLSIILPHLKPYIEKIF